MTIVDVVIPTELILPLLPSANQSANASKGQIGISGSILVFYDGSAWKEVTTV